MPDHAKQVGVLCQRVIDLLGLSMTEGQSILLGESNIAHMVSRHSADFALYRFTLILHPTRTACEVLRLSARQTGSPFQRRHGLPRGSVPEAALLKAVRTP